MNLFLPLGYLLFITGIFLFSIGVFNELEKTKENITETATKVTNQILRDNPVKIAADPNLIIVRTGPNDYLVKSAEIEVEKIIKLENCFSEENPESSSWEDTGKGALP